MDRICRLCVVAATDLCAWTAIKAPHLKTKTGRLDECISESNHTDAVGLGLHWLDVVGTVCLDVASTDEASKLICMGLDPSTCKKLCQSAKFSRLEGRVTYLEVRDDGHRDVHVVKRLEQNVGSSTIHELYRIGQLAMQIECLLSKINPDVARVANMLEQVSQRVETSLFILEPVCGSYTY